MAISKKAPKGVTQSDWNKIRTIYYLIDNDIIIRDPSMASYTDAPAYSSNKAKGAKEFIKHYHSMYSGLFKKGKAGDRLEEYVSKQKGRLEVKAQLQKFQDEGLIELPDYKMAANAQILDAQSQLDLSGGIFDVLKSDRKDKFNLSAQALSDRIYPLALDQSAATYNKFAQGLGVDYSDSDFERVKYEDLAGMTAAMEAGPARVLASNYYRDLKFSAPELAKKVAAYKAASTEGGFTLEAQPMPPSLISRVVDACNKAIGLIGIISNADSTILAKTMKLKAEDAGKSVEELKNAIQTANINRSSSPDQMETALQSIDLLVNGTFDGTNKISDELWTDVRGKMLQTQQSALIGIREQIANRTLINLSEIARQLQDVMIEARTQHKRGGIDDKSYRNIEKTLSNMRKQADSLPDEGSLLNYLNDGDLARVRDAKYRFNIIRKVLTNISAQLTTANKVSLQLRQKMQEGWTAAQVVLGLQQVYNLVAPALTVRPQELTTGFGDELRYVFSKASSTKPEGGLTSSDTAALKPSDLASAKNAVTSVRNALAQARRAGTERALQIYLYLIESTGSFKADLKVAWYLSTQKTSEDMSTVVASQQNFLEKTLNSPDHIRKRILRYYIPSAPYFIQNFMGLNEVGQKMAGASSMIASKDSVKPYIGADSISRIPSDLVDPRKLLEMLPSNIRAMSNDQAQARAKATADYIQELFGKYTTVVSTQANMMSAGGANYQEMMKSLDRQVSLLSEALKEAKFDNSCKLSELPRHNAGLFSVGFLPKMDTGALKPTLAIMSPDDLLSFQIFKGDTLVQGDTRNNLYRMRGGPADKTKPMLESRGGTSYIARRPLTTPWGSTELIDWSPLDAADLRNRFFCALYCYDLRNKELNTKYQRYLNEARNIPTDVTEAGSVLSDFGLVEDSATSRQGERNLFGGFNRW